MVRMLLLLPVLLAHPEMPEDWERRVLPSSKLASSDFSVLVPTGSIEQPRGKTRPGADEARTGWLLQSEAGHPGLTRLIMYLKRGSLEVQHARGATYGGWRTPSEFRAGVASSGAPWGEDQPGVWKGKKTILMGRRSGNAVPADAQYGVTVLFLVELGASEYVYVKLESHPDAVEGYLPWFLRVKDSLRRGH